MTLHVSFTMNDIHCFHTTRLMLTPDQLRRIAQRVEDKADTIQTGDIKTACLLEGGGQVVEFTVDNTNHFKKWQLCDYRISIIRDADAFNARLYDGETLLVEAKGVSPEDALSNLKEATQ